MKIEDLSFKTTSGIDEVFALAVLPNNIQIGVARHSKDEYELSAVRPDEDGTHSDDYLNLSGDPCPSCSNGGWGVCGTEEEINERIEELEKLTPEEIEEY